MRSGMLQHRLTFKRPVTARNEFGESADDEFEDVATVWGSIRPVHGNELTSARQRQSSLTHSVEIRYPPNWYPTPRWIFTARGRTFQIEDVRNDGENDVSVFIDAIEQVTGAV